MNTFAIDSLAKPQSRRAFLAVGALGGASALLAGCGVAAIAPATASKGKASLYLTIATPDMLGTDNMPAFIPAFASIPAHTRVRLEIVNFDDATALTVYRFAAAAIVTATATFGLLTGAKPMNQGSVRFEPVGPIEAVPVFPATLIPPN